MVRRGRGLPRTSGTPPPCGPRCAARRDGPGARFLHRHFSQVWCLLGQDPPPRGDPSPPCVGESTVFVSPRSLWARGPRTTRGTWGYLNIRSLLHPGAQGQSPIPILIPIAILTPIYPPLPPSPRQLYFWLQRVKQRVADCFQKMQQRGSTTPAKVPGPPLPPNGVYIRHAEPPPLNGQGVRSLLCVSPVSCFWPSPHLSHASCPYPATLGPSPPKGGGACPIHPG